MLKSRLCLQWNEQSHQVGATVIRCTPNSHILSPVKSDKRMRRTRQEVSRLLCWLVILLTFGCLQGWAGCDEVPAGQMLRIRLSQPVSSYSAHAGMPLRGILIESPECDGLSLFPEGTAVEGRVQSVWRVGLGFRHETATLELKFDLISPENGPATVMHTRVLDVDNARESVKNGVVRGVRSTATPQNHFILALSHVLLWIPYSYWIPAVSGAALAIVPEPEIYFPAGTDLHLELTVPMAVASSIAPVLADGEFKESERQALDEMVLSYTSRTSNLERRPADVVNLLFIGSAEQVESAFQAARWTKSDRLSFRSVLGEFRAVFSLSSDPNFPMGRQLLDGKASDSSWQKSFNSYAKRDHLRIWKKPERWAGQAVWLAASTAESGAAWSLRTGRFVHHVVPDVDMEREKVVRDLSVAGCVQAAYSAPRPSMPANVVSTSGTPLRTDGAVAVVQLRECQAPVNDDTRPTFVVATRPASRFARLVRAQVLSVRNLWRNNIVYDAVDVGRVAVRAIRNHAHERALAADREQRLHDEVGPQPIHELQSSTFPKPIPLEPDWQATLNAEQKATAAN